MANARDQMKMIDQELERIASEMDRLTAQRDVLLSLRSKMTGEPVEQQVRKRSPNIKPLVIDFMASVGAAGATSAEVDAAIRAKVVTVAKDTVASVLSRLKSEGAFSFDGERYYEKRFAPQPQSPFDAGLRAVI